MKPRHQHRYGQALLEFALAAPILLFLVMGILDFGRVIFAYAMASNSIRSALRNAEVLGYSATATYLDTDTMYQSVRNVLFVNRQTVTIKYLDQILKPDGSYTEIDKCEWDGTGTLMTACSVGDTDLENGDLLQIQSEVTINFITPLINRMFPSLTLDFEGQRTIVKNIGLGGDEKNDTDYDGLDDRWEIDNFGDLSQIATDDPDNDGCNNGCEEFRGTFPKDSDSDDEGLNDGEEIYIHGTEPLKWDTDGDNLNDKDEIVIWHTDPLDDDTDDDHLKDGDDLPEDDPTDDTNNVTTYPLDPDSDDDKVLDGDEVAAGTDPNKTDTDGDGLSDYEELVTYHTNPTDPDTDHDFLSDKREVDPSILTNPFDPDSDDDGLLDGDDLPETNPGDDANDWNTNPHLADSDADSLTRAAGYETDVPLLDGDEATGSCPRPDNPDSDGDLLRDAEELYVRHTNPCLPDTDGDGMSDYKEVKICHTDPTKQNPPCDDVDAGDSEPDGLPDSWEMTFFGNLDQTGTDDPDGDKCNNLCELDGGTDPTDPDTDHDRLNDYDEIHKKYWTDAYNPDTDGDRLPDGDEVLDYHTYPNDQDSDDDGLTDYQELKTYFTDPLKPDTDGDGLTDYDEVMNHKTDPLKVDTDGDGLSDYEEVMTYHTDPNKVDTDGDTLPDGDEVKTYHTDPNKADTDGEGLNDGAEVNTYKTDPNKVDTDGDTLSDYDEVVTYKTDPTKPDSDGDGLTDGDEVHRYMTQPWNADTDNDGLKDGDEIYTYSTNPLAPDTDGERLKDGEEVNKYYCNPTLTDTDADKLNDYDEVYVYHTICSKADSDDDGVSDGDELTNGTLPNNPIAISVGDVTVTEPINEQKNRVPVYANFVVRLSNPSVEVIKVSYTTSDFTAESGSKGDYLSSQGQLTFNVGETEKTVSIAINHDKAGEPNEMFYLYLLNPVNAYLEKPTNVPALGTIQDND